MKVIGELYRLREQLALDPVKGRIMLLLKDGKEHCFVWSIESKGDGTGRAGRAIPHKLL